MTAPTGPLAGIRVLDLCRLLPGAFAAALLADLGADVLKIEQPGGGDPMRAYEPKIGEDSAFTWVADRNKRSIALNLRDASGSEVLMRLARGANALLESFRPGVMDGLGLGYETLHAVNPALVYCSISGYGGDGPRGQEAGHDINYSGRAGLLSVTGVNSRPAIIGVPVADLAGGSLLGTAGLLAALVHAQRTNQGDHVDISMTDGAFAMQALLLGAFFADGRPPGIETELLNGRYPCYAVYECADGRHLTVGALESPFWRVLCETLGRADLIPTQYDPGTFGTWRELFAARPRDAWLETFAGVDACVGPVNDLREAVEDPQIVSRGMVTSLQHPTAGDTLQLGTPIHLRERPASVRMPAPACGEDTRAVLAELQYSEDEIEALLAGGAAQAASASSRP